jgi:hypothetical protein
VWEPRQTHPAGIENERGKFEAIDESRIGRSLATSPSGTRLWAIFDSKTCEVAVPLSEIQAVWRIIEGIDVVPMFKIGALEIGFRFTELSPGTA